MGRTLHDLLDALRLALSSDQVEQLLRLLLAFYPRLLRRPPLAADPFSRIHRWVLLASPVAICHGQLAKETPGRLIALVDPSSHSRG